MTIALWVIAICEVIRIIQNAIQLLSIREGKAQRDNAYREFIKSLKATDKEIVKRLLEEFEESEGEDENSGDILSNNSST